jgi:glycosyltransferase involved in cell wall biosynthesis
MRKIKVLVLSRMYPRKGYPSSGIFIHQQVKALKAAGIDIRVCAPLPWLPPKVFGFKRQREFYEGKLYGEFEGIPVYHPRYFNPPGRFFYPYSGYSCYLGIRSFVKKLYQEFPFDIIHSYALVPSGYCGNLLAKDFKVASICSVLGGDINKAPFENKLSFLVTKKCLKNVQQIISVSEDLKRKTLEIEPSTNKIKTIYNGVNLEIFNDKKQGMGDEEVQKDSLNSKYILFVGRISEAKGAFDLIEAFAELKDEYKDLSLVMIGERVQSKEFDILIRKYNLEKRVFSTGIIPYDEIPKWVNNCEMFVLPSYSEGVPNSVMEAMASGKPVIATRVGGIPEIITDKKTGLLVEVKDVLNLKRLIILLLNDELLRKEIGEEARRFVLDNFTWEGNATEIIKLYQEILNK